MRFLAVRVQNFRNIPLAALELEAPRLFLLGGNGQGKTNLLEALGFISALRSFRTADNRAHIRWQQSEAGLLYTVEHESFGRTEVEIRLRPRGKTVLHDGNPVNRLADLLGRFPTVVLNSQDLQMLRGSPQERRRFLDLTLSSTDAGYFSLLRDFHKGLSERNALLKEQAAAATLAAFEQTLAPLAARLVAARQTAVKALADTLAAVYRRVARTDEEPALSYAPDHDATDATAFRTVWEKQRPRDLVLGATSSGPHRDDLKLALLRHRAREYASEGQQRGLVLALKIAQAEYLRLHTGIQPVLLADDVLGELDPERRAAFWQALPGGTQVIASGTAAPPGPVDAWRIWQVRHGAFVTSEVTP